PAYAKDMGTARFYQGSIGTSGMHLLFVAESDNAFTTVPVSEIDAEQRMVVLPGNPGNVGESYGRAFEKQFVALAAPGTGYRQSEATVLTLADAKGNATDPISLSATLRRASGAALAGQSVRFSYEGTTQESQTGDNGVATVTVVPSAGGQSSAVAEFDGAEGLGSSEAKATVTAAPEVTALSLEVVDQGKNPKKGDQVTLRAVLLTDDSEPVAGRSISFTDGEVTLTASTTEDGVAEVLYTVREKNPTVTATWVGDKTYAKAEATAVISKTGKPGSPGSGGADEGWGSSVAATLLPQWPWALAWALTLGILAPLLRSLRRPRRGRR
ncbi:MAG: hypothetical protein WDA71_14215, partial [Actinomycetota bacterium]